MDDVKKEYQRLQALFADADEKQKAAYDGAFWEAAKLKAELAKLHAIADKSGLVKIDPNNPTRQKPLPIAQMIIRVSSNYLAYTSRIAHALGKSVPDDEDEDFENEYS